MRGGVTEPVSERSRGAAAWVVIIVFVFFEFIFLEFQQQF